MESEFFDRQIEKYVIKWKGYQSPNDAETQKIDGAKIGKIKSGGLIRKKASLLDIDDSVVLTIYKSVITVEKYEIKDSDENIIGIVENAAIYVSDTFMKNSKGEKILTAKRSVDQEQHVMDPFLLNGVYEINAIDGKNVAKFKLKHEIVKRNFLHSDHYNTCNLQITDLDFDRKYLMGFFISILSSFYDLKPGGAVGDFGGGFSNDLTLKGKKNHHKRTKQVELGNICSSHEVEVAVYSPETHS